MKKLAVTALIMTGMVLSHSFAHAQYKDGKASEPEAKTEAQLILEQAESSETPVVITLE